MGDARDPPNTAAQSEGVASLGILHLSLARSLSLAFFFFSPSFFLFLPGKVGHPAALLIVLPFISQNSRENKSEKRVGEEVEDAASLSLPSPYFAGGLG